ncbi:MAG: 50S ribosomal protein L23 [Candidatus Omnitrophota bacterium]
MKLAMHDVIREPSITEKMTKGQEAHSKFAFIVHPEANKKQIKEAVEKIFNVHVLKVNTMVVLGKWKRVRHQPGKVADWKRAVVTLKKGEKIDIAI